MRIHSQTANIHACASTASETTSQALLGERVKVLKVDNNWSQIELLTDGYIGHMENHHLIDESIASTHQVINKLTPLFTEPDIKSSVKLLAPVASELCLQTCDHDQFWRTDQQHYVWKQHTRMKEAKTKGLMVETAQALFLGAPYLWGGRSPSGLDCSAMVQLTAMLHGWHLPRDSSDQVAFFKACYSGQDNDFRYRQPTNTQLIEYANRQTDDLVYWPGHVAMVLDKDTVVHATAHSLLCCCEPLKQVEARAGAPESIWRLSG